MPNKKRISKTLTVKDENVPTRNSRGRIREEGASFPVPPFLSTLPADYIEVLADLKRQIAAAQTRAALSVNRGVIALYWHVGGTIAIRQTISGWGDAVVERLAHDLGQAFRALRDFRLATSGGCAHFFLHGQGCPRN